MGKIKEIKSELSRQIKIISVSFTTAINLLYIWYLRFALRKGIGNRYVNLTLAIVTAAFLVIYIAFSLFGKSKKGVRMTKKLFKRFKLIMKLTTVATAVYTVYTAVGSVSPVAIFLAAFNAVVLAIRLLIELIAWLIGRGARLVRERITERKASPPITTEFVESEPCESCEITLDDL